MNEATEAAVATNAQGTSNEFVTAVAQVSASYFAAHPGLTVADIAPAVAAIAAALRAETGSTGAVAVTTTETVAKATPAQIRKSITPDALISFEDGKPYKTLKRHLTTHGMTVAEYKAKWGLPNDYPTTAPNYSEARSQMAKALGLGQNGRGGRSASVAKAVASAPPPAAPKTKTKAASKPKAAAAKKTNPAATKAVENEAAADAAKMAEA